MTKDEALKLALEWYDSGDENRREFIKMIMTITAIKEALAQPEQESVAITITGKLGNIYSFTGDYSFKKGDKVYTSPPQRKPLTREQVKAIMAPDYNTATMQERADFMAGFRAAEAAHGIGEKR